MLSHVVPLSDEERIVSLHPTVMNLLFPKVSPVSVCEIPEVLEVQLFTSDEERMVPEFPTVMKVLFPYLISMRKLDVPEVLEVQNVLFDEVIIVPDSPTAKYVPILVLLTVSSECSSSFSPQEIIVKIDRKKEIMMILCFNCVSNDG